MQEREHAMPLIIRDDNVFGSAEQDAVRRDFSFNALFYDVERETIIDYVGGVHDVERRLLRSIGDPSIRMREDPIRMLRAIRLAARLGCRIDESTWEAIRRFHPEITHAAAPRVLEDLLRMFRGGAAAPAFEMLVASGAICTVLPELADHLQRVSRQSGGEEAEALRSALLVADAWTHSGRKLSDAVSLALLLGTPVLSRLHDPAERLGSGASLAIVGDGLRPAAQRLSISKRDMERIRQVLLNVGKLAARGGRRRRHAATLARRNYFPDTLDLFEILSHATGDLSEEVTRWRRRAQDGGASEDGATEGETEAREPREAPRRRRRRGGRRTRPPEA